MKTVPMSVILHDYGVLKIHVATTLTSSPDTWRPHVHGKFKKNNLINVPPLKLVHVCLVLPTV